MQITRGMKQKVIIGVIIAFAAILFAQNAMLLNYQAKEKKYKADTETLLQGLETYQTKDSLNVARVGALELSLKEYKKNIADDVALIDQLQTKNRQLQSVTKVQSETISKFAGTVKDSIVYIPGDTVEKLLRCVDISTKWDDIHGCADDGKFTGTIIHRDSLYIVQTTQYKRFWGFLWRTKKIKNRKVDVVSLNPSTKIMGCQFVEIK